jgi:hypothetical protein
VQRIAGRDRFQKGHPAAADIMTARKIETGSCANLGFHTPADVHYGRAELVRARRTEVLSTAYAAHPERFVAKMPTPRSCPPAISTLAFRAPHRTTIEPRFSKGPKSVLGQ